MPSMKALRPTEKQVRAFVDSSKSAPNRCEADSTWGRGSMVVDLRMYRAMRASGCLDRYPDAASEIEANLAARMSGYGLDFQAGDPDAAVDAMAEKARREWDVYEINGYQYDDFMDSQVPGFVCMWEFDNGRLERLPEWLSRPEPRGVRTPEEAAEASRKTERVLAQVIDLEKERGHGDSAHVKQLEAALHPELVQGPPEAGSYRAQVLAEATKAARESRPTGPVAPPSREDALREQQERAQAAGLGTCGDGGQAAAEQEAGYGE